MERVKKVGRILLPVMLVAGLGAGGWFGFHSEAFQRVLGKREGTRIVPDQARPEYASAVVAQRFTSVLDGSPSTILVEMTTTIDRASSMTTMASTRAETGLDAAQTNVGSATPPEVVARRVETADAMFEDVIGDTVPWTRYSMTSRAVRGSSFDPYLIPVRNDVIGLELATLEYRVPDAPAVPDTPDPAAGGVPHIPASAPPEVSDLRRWSFDLATFESVSPVAFELSGLYGLAPSTLADVTMGFDDAGVLRYLQVTVDPMAVPTSDNGVKRFSFEWRVLELSDAPVEIEVPTDFVDASLATAPTA